MDVKDRLLIKEKLYEWIRKHKEIVVTLIILAGILCFFLMNDFQSKEDYYDVTLDTVEEANSLELSEMTPTGISKEFQETSEIQVTNERNSDSLPEEFARETDEFTDDSETLEQNITTEVTTAKKEKQEETVPEIITVYFSIDCRNILDNMDNISDYDTMKQLIPENGVISKKTGYRIDSGSTVFDLLEMVTRANKIQLDYQGEAAGIYGTVYVKGINYIYEKSCGSSSGWMYTLNGEWVGVGCNSKKLKDGDYVQWRFTCDGGNDLR